MPLTKEEIQAARSAKYFRRHAWGSEDWGFDRLARSRRFAAWSS